MLKSSGSSCPREVKSRKGGPSVEDGTRFCSSPKVSSEMRTHSVKRLEVYNKERYISCDA